MQLSTRAIHADDDLAHGQGRNVAAAISVSTTFRYEESDFELEDSWDPASPFKDVYSRETTPVLARVEAVLKSIIGQPTICFASGAAAFASVLQHVQPDVVAVTEGYVATHGAIKFYRRTKGEDRVQVIALDDDFPANKKILCWVETPLNPTGESRDLQHYADKVHAKNGILGVDSTLAPPPMQNAFDFGADIVTASATKYFAGHSDCLVGAVSVKTVEEWRDLWEIRMYHGATVGSLEAWLLLRSLRTFDMRIHRQFETATRIAHWLDELTKNRSTEVNNCPNRVWHASLQKDGDKLWGKGKQLQNGPACFLIEMATAEAAQRLPLATKLFTPAASLGAVESLIEQRIMANRKADPKLVRLSIGCESFEDLQADLLQAFENSISK